MIYTTGTIAVNGNTLTGSGTNFTGAGSLIRVGCTVITMTSPPQVFQITSINSGTQLSVTPAASPALSSGTKYSILLSDSLSVDGLAQDIAETFSMYQRNISGFADVMNGTGDVTITVDGKSVTVPGQKSLAKKGANSDITELKGLKTALSVAQGGTGATDAAGIRQNAGLGTAATKDVGERDGNILQRGAFGLGNNTSNPIITNETNMIELFRVLASKGACFFRNSERLDDLSAHSSSLYIRTGDTHAIINAAYENAALMVYAANSGNIGQGAYRKNTIYGTANTAKGSDGTLKVASPIVKIFSDGSAETNDESEGCSVERLSAGLYLITGCLGMNADGSWGGIDGGFDIPKDRNGQSLIWLDYKVNADGSVLVKTYHRTYPDSPKFARNEIAGLQDGQPVDIPADQFVSARVEMPSDSIWNQKKGAMQSQQATEQAQK